MTSRNPMTKELIRRWLDRAERLAMEHGGNVAVARRRAARAIAERESDHRVDDDHCTR